MLPATALFLVICVIVAKAIHAKSVELNAPSGAVKQEQQKAQIEKEKQEQCIKDFLKKTADGKNFVITYTDGTKCLHYA
ncbi:hypothetical protein L596_018260 [Steinernema carpocapsae]|uniref:Uncharacterized protein n=1 Tax=Steinernema carpocapsae TaxID=34508 RepID=A0A4U5N4U3_STECR|nr:hypothetical protein L596_018260 [Steinernema carpocapsae]